MDLRHTEYQVTLIQDGGIRLPVGVAAAYVVQRYGSVALHPGREVCGRRAAFDTFWELVEGFLSGELEPTPEWKERAHSLGVANGDIIYDTVRGS